MRLIDGDELGRVLAVKWNDNDDDEFSNKIVWQTLREAPTVNVKNEWIPVSEKPKDEKKEYLVQLDGGSMCSCRWTNVNPFWTELTTEWHWNRSDIPQYSRVVAWMDLEPYREDGEE